MIREKIFRIIGFFLLLASLWLPRGIALDRFATPDEPAWITRSGNFYRALILGNYEETFQREHPGVTLMWAGSFSFGWHFPGYGSLLSQPLDGWNKVDRFLESQGYDTLDILTTGRVVVVAMITVATVVAFFFAVRLFGYWPALFGFLFIALNPFSLGFSRLLHLDALVSAFMLLAVLAFLSYLYRGRKILHLIIAGVAAGLGWLTKSPALFLIPFTGLILGFEFIKSVIQKHHFRVKDLWIPVRDFFVWGACGVATFFILWPAMWVKPVEVLIKIFNLNIQYAEGGHSTPIFFNGEIFRGDPGISFYPATFLWRTTPIVLAGLIFLLIFWHNRTLIKDEWRPVLGWLLAFVLLFTIFMSLGAKKFDRYLLPVYAFIDLLAVAGWFAAFGWLLAKRNSGEIHGKWALLLSAGIVAAQLFFIVPSFPYYMSYYNPLMGGGAKAPEVMQIGWGEGLDAAARYLNAKPNAQELSALAWYPDGVFSYFFDGETRPLYMDFKADQLSPDWWQSYDYIVLYIHQWQRQLPNPPFLNWFSQSEPEHIIRINGIDYAYIYAVDNIELTP